MVLTLAIPLRQFFGFKDLITEKHLDNAGRVMLAAGSIVAYGYLSEAFFSWYSGDPVERYAMWSRVFGDAAWTFWLMLFCNVGVLQLLWFKAVRITPWLMFILALFINLGMWLERYVIVVTSLARDYDPSMWRDVPTPTWTDFGLLFGSIGLFLSLFFLFVRVLPFISIFEVEELRHKLKGRA
jgi:molybdopterin-containing oxidoreductase family membrane subunit